MILMDVVLYGVLHQKNLFNTSLLKQHLWIFAKMQLHALPCRLALEEQGVSEYLDFVFGVHFEGSMSQYNG